jgi:hypothetical protein
VVICHECETEFCGARAYQHQSLLRFLMPTLEPP